ncbi:UNVERIFIED_CONTAM: hypothetical protein GTU68_057215 [Idotea baltica]|nr:hypothetical protein [Idotea baltica]
MTGLTFSKTDRLSNQAEYQYVFANARRFGNHNFTLLVRINDLQSPRLGLAISKKNVKLAKNRNRIKRLIRESFRHNKADLPPIDIIAMCRTSAVELSSQEIRAQLETQWRYIRKKIQG